MAGLDAGQLLTRTLAGDPFGEKAAAGTSTSTQNSKSTSGNQFNDPNLVASLAEMIKGVSGTSGSQFNSYLDNPAQSKMFQNSLQTVLQNLQPGEKQQRQDLQDQFRQAGALNSGAFANAATQNERNIGANRSTTAVNLLQSQYAPTLQALLGGISQANPLISNEKFDFANSESTGASNSQAYDPNSKNNKTPLVGKYGPSGYTGLIY